MADDKNTGKRTSLGIVEAGEKIAEKATDAAQSVSNDISVSEQIEALRAEVGRMKESAGLLAEGTGQLAMAQVHSLRDDVRETVKANPLATLAGAAFIGYLFGLRHR
jgi:hypothetical protein